MVVWQTPKQYSQLIGRNLGKTLQRKPTGISTYQGSGIAKVEVGVSLLLKDISVRYQRAHRPSRVLKNPP